MTVYSCNVIRPNGTSTVKEINTWDRQTAARLALQGEPAGSQTTAKPLENPVVGVQEDLRVLVSPFPLLSHPDNPD